jgi:hypothetical protein
MTAPAPQVMTGVPPETPENSAAEPTTVARIEESAARPPVLASEFGTQSMRELLHFAIEKGTPVESLEKLVALAKDMRADAAREAFNDAMASFQAECPPIFKAKNADFATKGGGNVKYDYASLDDIERVIKPILAKYGLSYKWNSKIEKTLLTVICIVKHRAGHSEPTDFSLPIDSNAAMSEQQKYGAALTFGQRRSLSAGLGLSTTSEDPDSPKLDPTPITEDQATVINDLLAETRMPVSRFLKYLDASSVDTIRAVDYQTAIGLLEDKKKKGRT